MGKKKRKSEPRILVVDDDALWCSQVSDTGGAHFEIVRSFYEGLALLDRRKKWAGAIFDRYMIRGESPYEVPQAVLADAGILFAHAFLEKFPRGLVCVASLETRSARRSNVDRILDDPSVKFVFKGRPRAAPVAVDFVTGKSSGSALERIRRYVEFKPRVLAEQYGLKINFGQALRDFRSLIERQEK